MPLIEAADAIVPLATLAVSGWFAASFFYVMCRRAQRRERDLHDAFDDFTNVIAARAASPPIGAKAAP